LPLEGKDIKKKQPSFVNNIYCIGGSECKLSYHTIVAGRDSLYNIRIC